MREPVVVLKFGSSVLEDAAALPEVVLEIYREVRRGRRVVAVVSAFGGATDELLAKAEARFGRPDPACLARFLETGEIRAAALLGMTLARTGVPARILDAHQLGLVTGPEHLDAEPRGLDAAAIETALAALPVVVVPGFAGRCAGAPTLLGRGGSDLTALFLADRLGAAECRLLKDVDGLFPLHDDGRLDRETRYATASWATCRRVGAPLVQPKAVEFAQRRGLAFTIARCGREGGTFVGPGPDRREPRRSRGPTRVALAGVGTVGRGVLRWLESLALEMEPVGVLARGAAAATLAPGLLCRSPSELLDRDPDLVVELLGGTDTAARLLDAARGRGVPVVSANKQLLAERPDLRTDVAASASVGGSVPVLERVRGLAATARIERIDGILNGTCNFLLARMGDGLPLDQALAEARDRGLAEADPRLDTSGLDCVHKLAILAEAAGCRIAPEEVEREGLAAATPARLARARTRGRELKLVACLERRADGFRASVRLRSLPRDHPLAGCDGERNRAVVRTVDGATIVLDGTGAGRWPTTLAVVSDVLDLRRAAHADVNSRCSA